MNDQERITDLMLSEKKMTANYDSFASECVNMQLRDEYLKLFKQGHTMQGDLFCAAQSRGWYQTEAAPASKVDQAKQKFTAQAPMA